MQGYQGEAQNAQEKITALAIFCERIKFHTSYILYWERTFMIMKWVRVKDLQMSSFKWLLRFELYLSCAIVITVNLTDVFIFIGSSFFSYWVPMIINFRKKKHTIKYKNQVVSKTRGNWNLKIYIVVLFWHELWVEYVYVLTLSGNFK